MNILDLKLEEKEGFVLKLVQFKKLTENAIWSVVLKLLEENHCTTTLEVKIELRKRGYWAIQEEVSFEMAKMEFPFFEKGNYRVYYRG